MTYDELVTRYQAAIALRRKAERRLKTLKPGSKEGNYWYAYLRRIEAAERDMRKAVLNHPDAPAQG